ncbi:MAG: YdcF family protein [Mariniphaga sp.]
MKNYSVFLFLIVAGIISFAGGLPDPKYSLIKAESYVQSKNYYLLTLLQQLPELNKLVSNDEALLKISILKKENLRSKLKSCSDSVNCYLESIKFNTSEIQTIGARLVALYGTQKEFKTLVQNHLIASGCYNLFGNLEPQEMLRKAWEQDARAVNQAIKVYAGGARPNYPAIDSVSVDVHWKYYPNFIDFLSSTIFKEVENSPLFFMPSMTFALHAIEVNERNRAADYEPMESGCNKQAYDRIKTVKWADFKYSLILVPGEGPEVYDQQISPIGMLRCRSAANRWKEGVAPFIMVSGGKVHPFKTKFSEAEEMKRFLMERLHVPENAIIMEPHARHTSTNMRNCARLIFRYGIPMEKPCLSSSNKEQSHYISGKGMENRCIEELGYPAYKNGNRISETEAEFYPLVSSLQIDFDEPLDP